jgi:hypothetical protein
LPVRFYIDADLLGVAKILAEVRSDVTYPGDPGGRGPDGFERQPCPVQAGDKDVEWIPQVARAGWVIISRAATSNTVPPSERPSSMQGRGRFASTPAMASTNGSSLRSS